MVLKLQMREKYLQSCPICPFSVWYTIPENRPSIVEAVFNIKNLSQMIWCNLIFQFIYYCGKLPCPSCLKIIPPKFIQYLNWSPTYRNKKKLPLWQLCFGGSGVCYASPPHSSPTIYYNNRNTVVQWIWTLQLMCDKVWDALHVSELQSLQTLS